MQVWVQCWNQLCNFKIDILCVLPPPQPPTPPHMRYSSGTTTKADQKKSIIRVVQRINPILEVLSRRDSEKLSWSDILSLTVMVMKGLKEIKIMLESNGIGY